MIHRLQIHEHLTDTFGHTYVLRSDDSGWGWGAWTAGGDTDSKSKSQAKSNDDDDLWGDLNNSGSGRKQGMFTYIIVHLILCS